jgi:uncharacterized OB-fold protein
MSESLRECFTCRQIKPLSEFYKDRTKPLGIGTRCKACSKQRDKLRPRNPNLEPMREKSKRWRVANPEKTIAHRLVRDEVKAGRLVRGVCERCGRTDAHAHHDDYSKPLDVRWLCPKHHKEHHSGASE